MNVGKIKSLSILNIMVAFFFMTTPLESVSLFEKFSMAKLSSLFVLVVWAYKGFPMRRSSLVYSFVGVLLLSVISVLWSIDKEHTLISIATFLLPCVLLTEAILSSIRKKEDITLYLFAYVVGCLIISISCIANRDTIIENAILENELRLTSFGQNQNVLAFLLTMGLVIVLSALKKHGSIGVRIIQWSLLVLFSFVSISTGSRMGMGLLCFVILLFLISSKTKGQVFLMLLFLVSFVFFMIPLIPSEVYNRFFETDMLIKSGDFSGRGGIWEKSWSAFTMETPFLGVGYSNFITLMGLYYSAPEASHNTYLTYIVEFGFAFFWVPFIPVILIAKYIWSIFRKVKDLYVFSYVLPLFIAMFVLETAKNRWIFIIGTLVYAWYKLECNKKSENEDCRSDS